jgi:hypothetical protein
MPQRIQYGWETITEALKHGEENKYDGSAFKPYKKRIDWLKN